MRAECHEGNVVFSAFLQSTRGRIAQCLRTPTTSKIAETAAPRICTRCDRLSAVPRPDTRDCPPMTGTVPSVRVRTLGTVPSPRRVVENLLYGITPRDRGTETQRIRFALSL